MNIASLLVSARRGGVAVLVTVTLLTPVGEAFAQTPDGSSAVDQYVEDVPTGEGSSAVGQKKETRKPLSASVQAQVQTGGGDDAAVLEQAATSAAYGAPQKVLVRAIRPEQESAGVGAAGSAEDGVAAVGSAVTGKNAAPIVAILIAVLSISVVAFALAGIKQRRRAL
jgi:hypothetical protein